MKTAIYPGSFNPWHIGHQEVVRKALQVFDKVVVLQLTNPTKAAPQSIWDQVRSENSVYHKETYLEMMGWMEKGKVMFETMENTLLVDAIPKIELYRLQSTVDAVIKGIRNGTDLGDEIMQQDWNEDLGLKIPILYLVSNRQIRHISSTVIRALEKFKPKEK